MYTWTHSLDQRHGFLLCLLVAAQLHDQDAGVRARAGGKNTAADFLAHGAQALFVVEEPWGVNTEKVSPLPFPGCFLTSFGNSFGRNPRVEHFFPWRWCLPSHSSHFQSSRQAGPSERCPGIVPCPHQRLWSVGNPAMVHKGTKKCI